MQYLGNKVSMRKSALKEFGGDLENLWDSSRFECGKRSRGWQRKKATKKDSKSYRPWQRQRRRVSECLYDPQSERELTFEEQYSEEIASESNEYYFYRYRELDRLEGLYPEAFYSLEIEPTPSFYQDAVEG